MRVGAAHRLCGRRCRLAARRSRDSLCLCLLCLASRRQHEHRLGRRSFRHVDRGCTLGSLALAHIRRARGGGGRGAENPWPLATRCGSVMAERRLVWLRRAQWAARRCARAVTDLCARLRNRVRGCRRCSNPSKRKRTLARRVRYGAAGAQLKRIETKFSRRFSSDRVISLNPWCPPPSPCVAVIRQMVRTYCGAAVFRAGSGPGARGAGPALRPVGDGRPAQRASGCQESGESQGGAVLPNNQPSGVRLLEFVLGGHGDNKRYTTGYRRRR